ncbi:hypothetical protein RchiOBHm_Chr6g0261251 [Rosa chinensis]|uniref:Uncharacterized protein n=1 Tax=Rosa chinensis TaxID=74649 RepID=A0A2P6PNB5_ROSCH|nr:hypothetical protein RchiOBHm_Chr6g0261251 [Rosa chinensis]
MNPSKLLGLRERCPQAWRLCTFLHSQWQAISASSLRSYQSSTAVVVSHHPLSFSERLQQEQSCIAGLVLPIQLAFGGRSFPIALCREEFPVRSIFEVGRLRPKRGLLKTVSGGCITEGVKGQGYPLWSETATESSPARVGGVAILASSVDQLGDVLFQFIRSNALPKLLSSINIGGATSCFKKGRRCCYSDR